MVGHVEKSSSCRHMQPESGYIFCSFNFTESEWQAINEAFLRILDDQPNIGPRPEEQFAIMARDSIEKRAGVQAGAS